MARIDEVLTDERRALGLDLGLFVLRVSLGLMMVFGHGVPKIGRLGADPVKFGDPLGLGAELSLILAIGAEAFCGALVVLGLGTRLAVIPLVFTMLVAAFVVHAADPFQKQEFALLYAIPFFSLLFTGPGRFSLDHLILQRRRRHDGD